MRIPLPNTLRNRSGNTDKDARANNCVAEIKRGTVRLLKRPALDQAFESLTGNGQLLTTRNKPRDPDGTGSDDDEVIVITDDTLTNSPVATVRALAFSVQPDESDISVAISPSVVVHALDSLGQVASGYSGNVTMEIANNPTGATLSGTMTVAAVAGVATFSNLKLDRSGADFTLRATDTTGLRQPVSDPFDIPTRLVFTTQPATTAPNTTMAAIEVTVQDPGGNTDTNYGGTVTLTLFGSAGGTLTGTATKSAANGVATFDDLQIDLEGTYDFDATATTESDCYPPASGVSTSFEITTAHLFALEAAIDNDPGETNVGYGAAFPGSSLSPTTLTGETISQISSGASPDPASTVFTLANIALPQTFFTSITINGNTLLTANANSYANGIWFWSGTSLVTGTGSFTVSIHI